MSDGTEGNLKVPSQIFRWFEKMKNNYENSVQSVLSRFEDYNNKQQLRIDNGNKEHIENLKSVHNSQIMQNKNNIDQLHQDINYYKEQISQQQKTIEQLNSRYDAVMACLINEKTNNEVDYKNTFENDDFFTEIKTELPTPSTNVDLSDKAKTSNNTSYDQVHRQTIDTAHNEETSVHHKNNFSVSHSVRNDEVTTNESLFDQAIALRNSEDYSHAFELFKQAADNNHSQSMGAMGRSYFLGEGVEENQKLGLAWLIKAAECNLPQAISRVEHFKEHEPELYQFSLDLVATKQI